MSVINYRNQGTFGGYREVFNKDAGAWFQQVKNGAKLSTTHCPAYGEFIHAGEFGYLNETTGVVSWLKVFELAEAITALSTTVKIYQREYDPTLVATDVLIKAPATSTTTGKAVTVGTLTEGTVDGEAILSFDITANDFGACDAGTLFVIGASAGTGKLPAIPKINVIFAETIEITKPLRTSDFQLGYADIATSLYYHACIERELIAIPAYVELLNKMSNSERFFQL